jgi:hypothetical protein
MITNDMFALQINGFAISFYIATFFDFSCASSVTQCAINMACANGRKAWVGGL